MYLFVFDFDCLVPVVTVVPIYLVPHTCQAWERERFGPWREREREREVHVPVNSAGRHNLQCFISIISTSRSLDLLSDGAPAMFTESVSQSVSHFL